jgi:hypothetical protein
MTQDNERMSFVLKFNEGTKFEEVSDVEIWCDGREYDPLSEGYRSRYSYRIVSEDWEYVDNDIRGVINEPPNLNAAARSLFAFLYACQEAKNEDSENYDLFPPHVREWAECLSEELARVHLDLLKLTQ